MPWLEVIPSMMKEPHFCESELPDKKRDQHAGPNAPKWRNIEAKLRPRADLAVWRRTFNLGNISTLQTVFRNWLCASPEPQL